MNRITNPLLMIIPQEAVGPLLALMIATGGILIVVGARKAGFALVTLAIAMPFIMFAVEILMTQFFTALPEHLIQPVATVIIVVAWTALIWGMVKLIFGQKAVDNAKGALLADMIRGIFRFLFWWPVLLVWMGGIGYLYYSAGSTST